jgi:hypothetical protein
MTIQVQRTKIENHRLAGSNGKPKRFPRPKRVPNDPKVV